MKRYALLVDDINKNKTYAITEDLNKVEFNCKYLKQDLNFAIGVQTAISSKHGATAVVTAGRYIVIVGSNLEETNKRMEFFDFKSDIDFRQVNEGVYSNNIVEQFEKTQSEMLSGFSPEEDVFDLVLAELRS